MSEATKKTSNIEKKVGMFIKDLSSAISGAITRQGLSEYKQVNNYQLLTEGSYSIIFAIVSKIAETVASVPFKLFKNGKEVSENDKVYKLLMQPNPISSWYDLIYTAQMQIDLTGERYFYFAKDRLKKIREIWVIPSCYIEPVIDNNILIKEYKLHGFQKESLPPEDVVFDRYPSLTSMVRGMSPLEKAVYEYDIHLYTKMYMKNFYKNGAVPQGILTTEQKLTEDDIERIARLWTEKYGGLSNSWKIAILYGGLKFEPISINPASKDFMEQANWSRDDICAIYKVPPGLLGYSQHLTKASAQVYMSMYMRDCILPRVRKLEFLFNQRILPRIAQGYTIKFANPVPEDEELNVLRAKIGGLYGVLTINEIRKLLGFEPLNDKIGNELVEPLNLPQGRKPKKEDENSKDNSTNFEIKELLSFLREYEEFLKLPSEEEFKTNRRDK